MEPRWEVWYLREGVLEQVTYDGLPTEWLEPTAAHAAAKELSGQGGYTTVYVVQRMVVATYPGGG